MLTSPRRPRTGGPAPAYEHERLYVRAIVIENDTTRAALISADQGNMPEEVWMAASKEIAGELKAPAPEHSDVGHAHAQQHRDRSGARGPGGPPRRSGPAASQAPPPLVAPMLQAVRQAKAALQPARVGFGTGPMWLNVNRDAIDRETRHWTQAPNLRGGFGQDGGGAEVRIALGRADRRLHQLRHAPGERLSVGVISADFPGAATRYIEQAYGGQMVALFSQGASGDQNPLYLRPGTNLMASRTGVPLPATCSVRENVEGPLRDGAVPGTPGDPKVETGSCAGLRRRGCCSARK